MIVKIINYPMRLIINKIEQILPLQANLILISRKTSTVIPNNRMKVGTTLLLPSILRNNKVKKAKFKM